MDAFTQALGDLSDAAQDLTARLMTLWLPIQLGAILAAAIVAASIAVLTRRRIDIVSLTMGWPAFVRAVLRAFVNNLGAIIFILLAGLGRVVMLRLTAPANSYLIGVAVDLATAWVVIALVASLIRNPFINRLVSVTAWTIAALSILGLLDDTVAALDLARHPDRRAPGHAVADPQDHGAAVGGAVGRDRDQQLPRPPVQHVSGLTPSIQVLLGKLIRIGVMTVAIVVVLSAAGIDLSVLAVFTGAIGVGVGLGLQKIVSNFVSGIILLADKSIKPGDVISVGDHFGWVANMGARYTSVTLKDGRELLVPNEDLVTNGDQLVLQQRRNPRSTCISGRQRQRSARGPSHRAGGGRRRRPHPEDAAAGVPLCRLQQRVTRLPVAVLDRGS